VLCEGGLEVAPHVAVPEAHADEDMLVLDFGILDAQGEVAGAVHGGFYHLQHSDKISNGPTPDIRRSPHDRFSAAYACQSASNARILYKCLARSQAMLSY
jgi:hypothetical protein